MIAIISNDEVEFLNGRRSKKGEDEISPEFSRNVPDGWCIAFISDQEETAIDRYRTYYGLPDLVPYTPRNAARLSQELSSSMVPEESRLMVLPGQFGKRMDKMVSAVQRQRQLQPDLRVGLVFLVVLVITAAVLMSIRF